MPKKSTRAPRKLSDDDIVQIRLLKGHVLQVDIAKNYGITQSMVSKIQRNQRFSVVEASEEHPLIGSSR